MNKLMNLLDKYKNIQHIKGHITKENMEEIFNKFVDENTLVINVSVDVDSLLLMKNAKLKKALYIDSSIEDYEEDLKEADEDENNFLAHYAEAAEVTEAYVMGNPIVALCGKIFIPSRDPQKLRVCPICKEIADSLFLSSE